MKKGTTNELGGSVIMAAGWLFADMLLTLTIIFLSSSTFKSQLIVPLASPSPVYTPTPTISPSPDPSPTPTISANTLILDPNRVTLTLTNINPDNLSIGDRSAITDLMQKIKTQITKKGLQHRRAGIEIAYGGADSFEEEDRGANVAAEVYKILDMLGQQRFVFCQSIHYDPLFTRLHSSDTVIIDIYFFRSSAKSC